MALQAYDPTKGYLVPVSQARVVAYVIDTETGKRYSTVAEAEKAIAEASAANTPKPKTVTSTTYEGSGKNRVKVTKYSDGTEERVAEPEAVDTAAKRVITGSGTKNDPLKVDGKVFSGTLPENNVYYENGVIFVYTPPASEGKTVAPLTPTDKTFFDKTINEIVSTGGKTDIGYTFGTPTGEPMPGSVVPSATGMKTFNYTPVSSMSEAQKRTYGIVLSDPNIDAVFFDQDTGTMYYRFKDGSRGAGDKGAFYRDPLGNIRPSSEIPYNYSTGFYASGSGGVVSQPYAPFSVYEGVPGVSAQGNATTGSGTVSDPLLVNNKVFNGVFNGVTYVNGVAQGVDSSSTSTKALTATDIETKARRTAQQDFKAALGELGLADLADTVDEMITKDFTVAQIKMELPKTAAYQLRFPGMAALRAAGRVINEATYISNEKGYLQTLRAYGLDTNILGSRSALGTYIANEVSPREFEERVNLASTRVNENPEVLETFKSFYPEVDKSGVITYLLNPKAGMAVIKKQVRTSEIGAAAASAGFARDLMGISNIETLLPAVGETAYAGLRTEFQRARQLAQNQRRLAQIEGQQYSDLEAVGAIVGDDAAKLLASERRAAREAARFSARGGVTGASLASPTAI